MRKSLVWGLALLAGSAAHADVIDFHAFNIRNSGTATELIGENGVEFVTANPSDKAGYGTDYFDGMTFAALTSMSFTIDNAAGPWMPYLNIWITDGTNYAVIANEPSNAPLSAFVPGGQAANGTNVSATFAAMGDYYIYEANGNFSWLTGSYSDAGRQRISYASLVSGGWTIGDPNPTTPWGGGGAPKGGYGFNFVYGDTLSNYVSGTDGYVISDIVLNGNLEAGAVVPLPAPLALGMVGMAIAGVAARRRKKA